jgi:hypothetical protein
MLQKLKYPIAKDKITKKLTNAKDAVNGKNCNCSCYHCDQDLIAVNRVTKQREHFRHDNNSNCSASYESYIHWLTKEVFKEIEYISLPDIQENYLLANSKYNLNEFYDQYKLPDYIRDQLNQDLVAKINNRLKNIKINTVELEKKYASSFGNVIVDVVLKFKNKVLFIEPFFYNPIDIEKHEKLRSINISTVSIKLVDFIAEKDHIYSIDELKEFISNNLISKKWNHIKNDAMITKNDFDFLQKKVISNIYKLDQIKKLIEKNDIINYEIESFQKQIIPFENEIKNLYNKIKGIKNLINDKERIKIIIDNHINSIKFDD